MGTMGAYVFNNGMDGWVTWYRDMVNTNQDLCEFFFDHVSMGTIRNDRRGSICLAYVLVYVSVYDTYMQQSTHTRR